MGTWKNHGNLFHIHWWGYAQGGYRQRCGPVAAAGRSSGASGLLHGHPSCSQGPCLSLQAQHMVKISRQPQPLLFENRDYLFQRWWQSQGILTVRGLQSLRFVLTDNKPKIGFTKARKKSLCTFQQCWRPELDRHVRNLTGQLHGRYNHVVAFLKEKWGNCLESKIGWNHHDDNPNLQSVSIKGLLKHTHAITFYRDRVISGSLEIH